MATFNGATIIPLPSSPPAPRSIEWQLVDTAATSTNPFTGQQQIQSWGVGWLEASISYAPMSNAQANAWFTWLALLQGTVNIFQMGDPMNVNPAIVGATAPNTAGTNLSGAYVLNVSGGSNQSPGDWIQVGYRLYRITSVNAGVLGIWPQIRETISPGTPTTIVGAQGVFRLKSPIRKISVKETKTYGLTFEIREAL